MQLTKDPQGILEMLRLCDQVRLGPRVQGLRSRLCGRVRLGFDARLNRIQGCCESTVCAVQAGKDAVWMLLIDWA